MEFTQLLQLSFALGLFVYLLGKFWFFSEGGQKEEEEEPTVVLDEAAIAAASTPSVPVTRDELRKHDGSDASRPLYIGVSGKIYDVSTKRSFYGPKGPYGVFAGRDATRALAKSSLDVREIDEGERMDLSEGDADDVARWEAGLSEGEVKTLREWVAHYDKRYPCVGRLVA